MKQRFIICAALLSMVLTGCASNITSDGKKEAWSSYMLPNPPEDGYISPTLVETPMNADSPVAQALARHKAICAKTGCPEWASFIAEMKKKAAGGDSWHKAWLVHANFSQHSFRYAATIRQYQKKNYLASPAEFMAAGKTGDLDAMTLAEFQALKEIGWSGSLRYAMLLINKTRVPTVLVRAPDWKDNSEHMLWYLNKETEAPEFYGVAALLYSTDGEKFYVQPWVLDGKYALNVNRGPVSPTGDRTSPSLFY